MPRNLKLKDPIEILHRNDIIDLVIRSSYWASPESFDLISEINNCDAPGVFFPYCKRKIGRNRGMLWVNENNIIYYLDYNLKAQNALSISMFGKGFKSSCAGYTCGHIYGKEFNRNWKNYTCIANMVLIPQPLQSLTDYHTVIICKLKSISKRLYNWKPAEANSFEDSISDEEFNSINLLTTPDNFKTIYKNKLKDYYNTCVENGLQPSFSLMNGEN